MKTITNVATLCMSFGLAVFAGSFLFSAGTLSVVGWLVTIPLFIGATGHTALSVYNLIPEGKEKPAVDPKEEINKTKEQTQTA